MRAAVAMMKHETTTCRAGFLPIAGAVVECDGVGVTSSNYALFPFHKIERPTYPLDEMT